MTLRENFTNNIKTWKGVKFKMSGFDRSGCDCAGLIIGSLYEANVIQNEDYYQMQKSLIKTSQMSQISKQISLNLPKYITNFSQDLLTIECGNVLVFNVNNANIHLGVALNKSNNIWQFIHSYTQARKVCISNLNSHWHNDCVGHAKISFIE